MSVCVVVVNWNGWADTLECLESLLRLDHGDYRVVVCDNGSTDDSVQRIRDWAAGRLPARAGNEPLAALTTPPSPKPVPLAEHDRESAEAGGAEEDGRLVLVRVGANLGFAGGNNVGLRYALARGFRWVWLLNNDTVAAPDALSALVREAEREPAAGMVGSKLLYYDHPERVQALGGASYNAWLALPRHLGSNLRVADEPRWDPAARMAYVVGASMLVSAAFVREVGLMSEEYFLFFEELDWVMRGGGRWRLGYAPGSVVYHKEGGSIGGDSRHPEKSWTADYHFMRSRLLFTRKFLPSRLPGVYVALLAAMLRRARRGRWDRVRMIASLCRGR
jgi:GT2 family glycosyltransferase